MELRFEAVTETRPGAKWQTLFRRYWPAYRNWFVSRGGTTSPDFVTARKGLQHHMPELLPTFDRLVELTGGDELAGHFLSCFRPPPYLITCSQAALSRPGNTVLVRNYDLDPNLNEGLILHSAWNARRVIATSEFLWGVADGMNDAGLALSLAFGGRKVVGEGFGIPLILRYVLEVCGEVADAVEVLHRVPSHMSYNVTLLDRAGKSLTVQVAPDRPTFEHFREGNRLVRYSSAGARLDTVRATADAWSGQTDYTDLARILKHSFGLVRDTLEASGQPVPPGWDAFVEELERGGEPPWEKLGAMWAT